jgi:hypothetical protein
MIFFIQNGSGIVGSCGWTSDHANREASGKMRREIEPNRASWPPCKSRAPEEGHDELTFGVLETFIRFFGEQAFSGHGPGDTTAENRRSQTRIAAAKPFLEGRSFLMQ